MCQAMLCGDLPCAPVDVDGCALLEEYLNMHAHDLKLKIKETRASRKVETEMPHDTGRTWDHPHKRHKSGTKWVGNDHLSVANVLSGVTEVLPLNFGSTSSRCPHCKAHLFPNETPGLCCGHGKVDLPPLCKPPAYIADLYKKDDPMSKVSVALTHVSRQERP
jgi:hypothetical protein